MGDGVVENEDPAFACVFETLQLAPDAGKLGRAQPTGCKTRGGRRR